MNGDFYYRLDKFLTLFGLEDDFSPDDLVSSYRALAKLNHPDLSGDTASNMRMIIVNEGYEFLKNVHGVQPIYRSGPEGYARERRRARAEDPAYRCYKAAFEELRGAFDDYFGRPGRKGEGDISLLKTRLAVAKEGFSRVINDFPYGEWVDDAIDRINSINRWLG